MHVGTLTDEEMIAKIRHSDTAEQLTELFCLKILLLTPACDTSIIERICFSEILPQLSQCSNSNQSSQLLNALLN
jgi:hypothetical protein